MDLYGIPYPTGNTTYLYPLVVGVRYFGQVGYFVLVEGYVETKVPAQVFFFNQTGIQGEFYPAVFDVPYVGQDLVGEVGARRYGDHTQQVLGFAGIHVNRTRYPATTNGPIDPGVQGFGLFPLDVGVITFGAQRSKEIVAKLVLRGRFTRRVARQIRVIATHILLTSNPVTQA